MKKQSDEKKRSRKQSIRRTFYRIQGVLGMTERECRMFMMLASLLLIGSAARYFSDNRSSENPEAFALFDARFNRLTARADSLDRVEKLALTLTSEENVVEQAAVIKQAATKFSAHETVVVSRININQATSEELQRLPRIGPALAKQIIIMRTRIGEFLSADDLLLVSGIGEKTLARLRPLITVVPVDSTH